MLEVCRNEGLKSPQSLDGAIPAPPTQDVDDGVFVEPGHGADLLERKARRQAPRIDARESCLCAGHDGDHNTKLWAAQPESQGIVFCEPSTQRYGSRMPYDKDRSVAAIDALIEQLGSTAEDWCRAAGLSKNAIGEFRSPRVKSMKVATAVALAEAVNVSPLQVMGLQVPAALALPAAVIDNLMAEVDAATTASDANRERFANARKLLAALAQSAAGGRPPRLGDELRPVSPKPRR